VPDVRAAYGYPKLERLAVSFGNLCNRRSFVLVVGTKGNHNLRKLSNARAIPWPFLHICFLSRRKFVLHVFPRGEESQAGQLRFLMNRWGIAACALLFRFVMTTARRPWNFPDWLDPIRPGGRIGREWEKPSGPRIAAGCSFATVEDSIALSLRPEPMNDSQKIPQASS
jgi:hypothetical protein